MRRIIGSVIICGMIRISSYGQTIELDWAKGLGDTGFDEAWAVASDISGNAYYAGYFAGIVDFDPGPGTKYATGAGGRDAFVSKLDANGNLLWAKHFGWKWNDWVTSLSIDPQGNVIFAGVFVGNVDFDPGPNIFNMYSGDYGGSFIVKLDTDGNFIWAKQLEGSYQTMPMNLVIDGTGDVYLTGNFYATTDFDPGPGIQNLTTVNNYADAFILKLDTAGNYVWAKSFGGMGEDYGLSLCVDSSGNIYTTGSFSLTADFDPGPSVTNLTSAGNEDVFVTKYDNSGSLLWARKMGGPLSDWGSGIEVGSFGEVYVGGRFAGSANFNPGGTSQIISSNGSTDGFILKLDASGNFDWVAHAGGPGEDLIRKITISSDEKIFATGRFAYSADFDPGTGTYNLSSYGGSDVFIWEIDKDGNYKSSIRMGGPSDDEGTDIAIDTSSGIYLSGFFEGTSNFDPNGGNQTLTSNGYQDCFVVKLSDPILAGINYSNPDFEYCVYPNPSSGLFFIHSTKSGTVDFEIYDVVGQLVNAGKCSNSIDLQGQPNGIYIIKLYSEGQIQFTKVLIH
jgi:hypothetical protein